MVDLFTNPERSEDERLYAAGWVRTESPYSGAELWHPPGGTGTVTRAEAVAWLRREEGERS